LKFLKQFHDEYKEINDKLSNLIAQEEAYWKQRAKTFWLKERDINSKFFIQLPQLGKSLTPSLLWRKMEQSP